MYTRVFSGSTQRSLWRCHRSTSRSTPWTTSAASQTWARIATRAGASSAHRSASAGLPAMVSAPEYDLELADFETDHVESLWETSTSASTSGFVNHAGHADHAPTARGCPHAKRINLGYTCDNISLKREHNVYTSRSCIRKTFETKGLQHVSGLALANCLDLLELIKWNHEQGIHLYQDDIKAVSLGGALRARRPARFSPYRGGAVSGGATRPGVRSADNEPPVLLYKAGSYERRAGWAVGAGSRGAVEDL